MKIGVLTFHRASNYGTVLQAQATVTALQELGYDAELIDYRPEYNERTLQNRQLRQARSIKTGLSIILNRIVYGNQMQKKITNFQEYIGKMQVSAETAYTCDEVFRIAQQYDVILSGSDQLWNERITGNDLSYFFPFEHPYKISYASSFGVCDISEERKTQIEPLLRDFRCLGMREKTAQHILEKSLQIPDNRVACVVDPTLLIEKETWLAQANKDLALPKSGYILTYYMIETPILRTITHELKRRTGLPVVNLKPSKRQALLHEGHNMMWAGPREFLSCYAGAHYVVSNSFHGTAFAINFEIPMYIAPLPFSMAGEVNSRLVDVLDRYGLSKRWISTMNDATNLPEDFDRILLQQSKRRQRKESIEYLKKALENLDTDEQR